MSNKKKKQSAPLTPSDVTFYILSLFVSAYACVLFIAMPLITHNKYYDIGDYKYKMFMYISVWFLIFSLLIFLVYFILQITSHKITKESALATLKSLSTLDWFVIAFLIASFLSYILSPYKTNEYHLFNEEMLNKPWDGYTGWNMGLRSQIIFVLLYFLISRAFRKGWKNDFLMIVLGSASIVFILGILHRFYIDPMDFYTGLDDYYKLKFLSTLGQSSWYSSFMVIILPIGMSLFLYQRNRKSIQNILLGIFVGIGAATFVTQNSDSAYLAYFYTLVLLFAVSFKDNDRFLKFLEMLIIVLGSFKIIGIFQKLFPERIPALDSMSIFMSQSIVTWILLVLVVVFYLLMRKVCKKESFTITKFTKVRTVLVILAVACLPLGILFAYLNTKGLLPIDMFRSIEYLNFNDSWGNNRGFTWRNTFEVLRDPSWYKRALTGPGPDCYDEIMYATEPRASQIRNYWHGEIVVCAHNEWLNMLFNEGILGIVSYLGIFISGAILFIKDKENPLMIAGTGAIIAYFLHNMFCYQQILCTPMIFCIIGYCEYFRRNRESKDL